MKKLLLSLVALIMSSIMYAGECTFTYATGAGSGDGSTWVYYNDGQFTITQKKETSKTEINTTYATLRLYKAHSMSIEATAKDISILSVTFLCDTEDYAKTLCSCTATTAGTWSQNGKEVTFTLSAAGPDFVFTADQGQVRFSKISISYAQGGETIVKTPTFSIPGGNYYEAQTVALSAEEGTIYYSFDGENYTKYTAPLTVAETTTISAYTESNGKKSDVKTTTYAIAKTYANLDELLKETPTKEGWPVIVTLEGEEIASFYMAQDKYKNGVYLTRKANGKNFELYKADVPAEWKAGDKLTGTAKGLYQDYNGQWEISLNEEGWANLTTGNVIVKAPQISFNKETATVTITDPSGNNNTIFYTLDGSDPDDSAILYEGPFTLKKSSTVKAVCYDDDDQVSAVTSYNCTVDEAPFTSCLEMVENCTATSQDSAPTVTFEFTSLNVTGVNGSSVYVADETGAFQFYGKDSKLKRGDVISGKVSGKLYSYNGLPELNVSAWTDVTVASTTEIVPTTKNAADITAADANAFVRLESLTFVSQETVSKKENYTFKQGETSVVLRDNFSNLSNITFDTSKTYNLNVFVIPFKQDIQYYAVTPDDIEIISNKLDPETRFVLVATLATVADGEGAFEEDDYETLSDGAVTFTSSNENVATIDNNGVFTIKAAGVTTITVETAETDKYDAGKSSAVLAVVSHCNISGEDDDAEISTGKDIADPWEAIDAQALYAYAMADEESVEFDPMWFHGYIVGYADGSMNKAKFDLSAGEKVVASNILISSNPNASTADECVPVQLTSKTDPRAALNLLDNPANLGKEVWVYGQLDTYFSIAGIKNVTDWSFDGTPASIEEVTTVKRIPAEGIFNMNGQRLAAPQKGLNIINGVKVLVK